VFACISWLLPERDLAETKVTDLPLGGDRVAPDTRES